MSHCTASCGQGLKFRDRACSEPTFGGNDLEIQLRLKIARRLSVLQGIWDSDTLLKGMDIILSVNIYFQRQHDQEWCVFLHLPEWVDRSRLLQPRHHPDQRRHTTQADWTANPQFNLCPFSKHRKWIWQKKLTQIHSWKMSNPLHGPESSNQILPREKRVNRDIFSA